MSDQTDVLESLRVQILRAEPGDIVVLTTPDPITPLAVARIKQVFGALLPPDVRLAVAEGGLHVDAVVRPTL